MKRIIAAFSVLLLTTLGLIAPATPASAATCNTQTLCMWTGSSFTGTKFSWGTGTPTYCQTLSGWTINNNMESVMANHSGKFTRFFNSHNCTGTVLFWFNGSGQKSTLGANANVVSSYEVCWDPAC